VTAPEGVELVRHRVLVLEGRHADAESGFSAVADSEGETAVSVVNVDVGGRGIQRPLNELGRYADSIGVDFGAGLLEDPSGALRFNPNADLGQDARRPVVDVSDVFCGHDREMRSYGFHFQDPTGVDCDVLVMLPLAASRSICEHTFELRAR
jgi:hypothetical protein